MEDTQDRIKVLVMDDMLEGMGGFVVDGKLYKFTTLHNIPALAYGVVCPKNVNKGEYVTVEILK
jgi:hypothetical protein